jgi:hypothetical protein
VSDTRRDPSFACSRRRFFPALLREAAVTLGMLRGGFGCRISDLSGLPDDQLAKIKPVLNPMYEILVEQDQVLGKNRETEAIVQLFSKEEEESRLAFSLFNGKHTLAQVGERVAEEMGWDGTEGFAHAKEMFLSLVTHLVLVPQDPIIPAE